MDNRKLKPEAILYSIEGQPNVTRVDYFDADSADNDGTELEQSSDRVGTTSVQSSDSVSTTSVQSTNNVRTISVQHQDRNKTDIARASKRPQETHQSVYAQYYPIVKLLTSRNFIRLNTSNAYRRIIDLPLSRAPKDLTAAVNAMGYNVSRDDLAKIYTAANVCKRVPRWKVYCITVFTVIATSYAVNTLYRISSPTPDDTQPTSTATSSPVVSAAIIGGESPLDAAIREWESSGGAKIWPGGREALARASVGMSKTQILELINRNVK
jgi:hypothetical protein